MRTSPIPQSWKSISVFFDESPEGRSVADRAAILAKKYDAHLTGIYVMKPYVDLHPTAAYAVGKTAIDEGIKLEVDYEREQTTKVSAVLDEVLKDHSVSGDVRSLKGEADQKAIFLAAFCSDLIVCGYPKPPGLPDSFDFSKAVLDIGGPVLLLPREGTKASDNLETILIAWNGSETAFRAIRQSLPLLKAATSVIVAMVAPEKHDAQFYSIPGNELSAYLKRHDISVQLLKLSNVQTNVAETIEKVITDYKVDLLVLGAFSHHRLKEEIFGGVTKFFFHHGKIPVFTSI